MVPVPAGVRNRHFAQTAWEHLERETVAEFLGFQGTFHATTSNSNKKAAGGGSGGGGDGGGGGGGGSGGGGGVYAEFDDWMDPPRPPWTMR